MLNTNELTRQEWSRLAYAIQRRQCVLVIGPNLATETVDGLERSLSQILADELLRELGDEGPKHGGKILSDALPHAALRFQFAPDRDPMDLERRVTAFYRQRQGRTSSLHRSLAGLPFHFVLNATFDRYMQVALRETGTPFTEETYNFNRAGRDLDSHDFEPGYSTDGANVSNEPSRHRRFVYNLFGSLSTPESLVVSEEHLLTFLERFARNSPPIPKHVRSRIQSRVKFLFLGFGFRQWYLRLLLHILFPDERRVHSLALEHFATLEDSEIQQASVFFRDRFKLFIRRHDLSSFVDQLTLECEGLDPLSVHSEDTTRESVRLIPQVFICHDSSDKQKARLLRHFLRSNEIDAWMDEEDIELGDRWNQEIESVIHEEIDFFLILGTQTLTAKSEGYVFKEIRMALRKADYFADRQQFILPLAVEKGVRLDIIAGLQEFQHKEIDWMNDRTRELQLKGIVSKLKRDFQLRRRT